VGMEKVLTVNLLRMKVYSERLVRWDTN
jgi:hypothetical protein